MHVNVAKEVAVLAAMTVKDLRAKYAQVFGEETRVGNRSGLLPSVVMGTCGHCTLTKKPNSRKRGAAKILLR